MRAIDETDIISVNEKFNKMSYEDQIRTKEQFLSAILMKKKIKVDYQEIMINPNPLNYRHKVVVSATNIRINGKNRLRLGLYKEGTKTIIPGVKNRLHDKMINDVLVSVEEILNKYKFEAYSSTNRSGIIKHILVRKSYLNNTMILVFVTQGYIFPNHKKIIKDILAKHKNIKTVVQNIHNRDTAIVLLEENKILYGAGYIEDGIEDLRFRLSANSFYQVNPVQMLNLYKLALDYANIKKGEIVMDCYCGIGTISLLAAKRAKEVIGVESNSNAVKDAIYNKKLNNVENIQFYNSDVEDYMFDYNQTIDVLILDPPRDGASAKFIEAVKRLKPNRIVYISCYIETQIRDILMLKEMYNITKSRGVDMFSYTSHLENVMLLELR